MSEQHTRTVDIVVTGAAEVLTCAADASDLIGLTAGGVAIDDGRVIAVGDISAFAGRRVVDARGGVVMPGFVDAHTHVVFGGSRVQEYAAEVAGRRAPADTPAGIAGTTDVTRSTTVDDLAGQAAARVREMLDHGTTTVESKSGYGLEPAAELRILQASNRLDAELPVAVITTYLGAHAFPAGTTPEKYLDQVLAQIPEVADAGLAEFCDVYCDTGYFDLAQSRRILETGAAHGLRPKIHLDAYSHTGAADLAIDLAAVSVDHLNYTEPAEVRRLAGAGVAGVYMPCLDYAVAHPRPVQARALADAGLELALATDMCPGCWATSMQLAVAMACRTGGLSVPEAVRAATYGAARSLGRQDTIGSLEPGKQADLIVLDLPGYEHLAYRLGRNSVTTVLHAGQIIKEPPQ